MPCYSWEKSDLILIALGQINPPLLLTSLLHRLMSSTRLQPHQSLPAPVVHATFSTQSKSHVLAGVQDAYWSDDEAVWGLILLNC